VKYLLAIILVAVGYSAFAQPKPAYQLFTANGTPVDYGVMLKDLAAKDVIFFGEFHNNPICHWLQFELTQDIGNTKRITLGAEMFEADNQAALNEYLAGRLSAKGLDSAARLWNNYKTDYAPLVNYAKAKGYPFIATNIPRRFASRVSKSGLESLDSLTDAEKLWIAPLPIAYDAELPGYKNMIAMMGGHGGPNIPKAQASKDATMAYFIAQHLEANTPFIHYNGAYHSENFEGILWYLNKFKPGLQMATITTVSQQDLSSLDKVHFGKASYVLVVDADMTTTY
jgi:uncharacterized iron-regulated protein